ncbi:MAG: PadR family transcriptional regulator [Promethearchaeota archaeon]
MLQFLIIHLLSKKPTHGSEIAKEIGRRKGEKPSLGTIYPALKDLLNRGIIKLQSSGKRKVYSLAEIGKNGLEECRAWFKRVFGDLL